MPASFLQSGEWEEFQRHIGRKTLRIEHVLCIRHDLPGGFHYLYCPRPLFRDKKQETRDKFFEDVRAAAQNERSLFLKIDPLDDAGRLPVACHLSQSIQPQESVAVLLDVKEEEVFARMHEKTRYNIRLALRRGVVVHQESPVSSADGGATGQAGMRNQEFEIFWNMLRETAARDGFHTHEKRYYEKLVETKSENFTNELFFARMDGVPVAAAMVNFYRPSGIATYLHGASGRAYRDVMAPHLLHWHIMQEARRRGFRMYDFWGIDERRWPGLTRFKKGFGGEVVTYPSSIDVVCRPFWYWAYRIARKFL